MNQILNTYLQTNNKKNNKLFKIQFIVSSSILLLIIIFLIWYFIYIQKKEKISSQVIDNYNVSKLYTDVYNNDLSKSNNIFGIIDIPKINIYYPIFSTLNDDLLKIAPCKFYGDTLNKNDNICIAGHNYNNSLFFSNISLLNQNDEIYIYDNQGNKYIYNVLKIYEVKYDDLSPIFNYDTNSKELTLVTCNNLNSNRIILKAKQNNYKK